MSTVRRRSGHRPPTLAALMTLALAAGCGDGYTPSGNNAPEPCTTAAECDDGDDCTTDECSPAGLCVRTLRDGDGDGVVDAACGGLDCDDESATVYPGAPETCNGVDDDCDGEVPAGELDGDGDGFAPCGFDGPASADCDDSHDLRHPGAREICGNGIDDNCNSLTDGADLACSTPPANDSCAAPEALTLPASIQASTLSAANDAVGSCGGEGPDVVYSLGVHGLWHITARVDTLTEGFDPLLHVRAECDHPDAELKCADDSDGLVPIVNLRAPPSGLYHLHVDGAQATDVGDFDLTVSATPVVNDLCAEAVDVSSGGVWHGTTAGYANHYMGSCSSSGPEAVFTFTLPGPRHVYLDLTGTSYAYTTLHLQTVCGDPAGEVACHYDASAWTPYAIDTDLPAGTYYLFVDSVDPSYYGDYVLSVSISMQ